MIWVSTIALGIALVTIGTVSSAFLVFSPWLPLATSISLTIWGIYVLYAEYVRQHDRIAVAGRSILVTGCDTGIGHELAKHLDLLGATVYAGCLNSSGEEARMLRTACSSNLHVVQLNVTKQEQIDAVYEEIKGSKKELWGVVNNSGIGCWGAVEVVSLEWMQRTMDINMFGMVRVCKKFLPLIRRSQGRIVNVSSCRGLLSQERNSGYCMSKFAVEAFSDSLRREMKCFGVHVIVIEPCQFGKYTKGGAPEKLDVPLRADWDRLGDELKAVYPKDKYVEQFLEGNKKAREISGGKGTLLLSEAIVDGLFSKQPCCRYLIGGPDRMIDTEKAKIFINWMVPTPVIDCFLSGGLR